MLIEGVRDYDRIYELMFESDYEEIIKIMTGDAPNGYTGHDDVDFHDVTHIWGNGMTMMVIGEVVSIDKDGVLTTGNVLL